MLIVLECSNVHRARVLVLTCSSCSTTHEHMHEHLCSCSIVLSVVDCSIARVLEVFIMLECSYSSIRRAVLSSTST